MDTVYINEIIDANLFSNLQSNWLIFELNTVSYRCKKARGEAGCEHVCNIYGVGTFLEVTYLGVIHIY